MKMNRTDEHYLGLVETSAALKAVLVSKGAQMCVSQTYSPHSDQWNAKC